MSDSSISKKCCKSEPSDAKLAVAGCGEAPERNIDCATDGQAECDASPTKISLSKRAWAAQGQPIGRLMATALQYPDLLSLAAGFVDNETLPCEAINRCTERLAGKQTTLRRALQYDSTSGNRDLREVLAQRSADSEGHSKTPHPDNIILTAGSNQFLHLLAEAIVDPGDIILAAAPTYFVFMGTLRGLHARIVGVRADEDGLCIDSLESTLEELRRQGQAERVKAIYSVTDFDNPAGSTLSLSRRHRLLDIVARWRSKHGPTLLISDNAYHLLRYEGESLPQLSQLHEDADDFVVEVGTFSKSLSPGVRVGWGVVPSNYVEPLLNLKANMDFGSPHFSQAIMYEMLTSGEFDQHLPKVLAGYRIKRDAMLAALAENFAGVDGVSWRTPTGGLYVWLTLPSYLDASEEGQLWRTATESGVLYVPGHYCYPCEGEPVAKNTIRLSFGVQSPDGIREGIRRLAEAVKAVAEE